MKIIPKTFGKYKPINGKENEKQEMEIVIQQDIKTEKQFFFSFLQANST